MIGILLLLLLPFPVGMVWDWLLKKEKRDWAFIYLYGSLTEIVLAGIVAMPAVKLRLSFGVYRGMAFGAIGLAALLGMLRLVKSLTKAQDNWRIKLHTEKNDGFVWAGVLFVFVLIASCYFQYVPAVQTDMTAETIHTTVRTDTLFEYNPATGEKLTLGIYPQDKLVTLPLFYSLFYSLGVEGLTGMPFFLYELVPVWILLLNFLVFWKWAENLFLGQKKEKLKRPVFLCFYGAANLFGDYLFITFSYKLLHQAWTGEAVLATVILPLLTLQFFEMAQGEKKFTEWWKDMRKERRETGPLLCLLAGIFCAPWRETLCLYMMILLGSVVAAFIWRRQHERNSRTD